jgi:tetratricopeptide (TPR) repeat protein
MQATEAIVLGSLNTAIFWDGENYYLLDEGAEPRLCRAGEIASLVMLDPSSMVIVDSLEVADLRRRIEPEKGKSDALFFFLASLDARVDPETRLSAAEFVNELIADPSVYSYTRLTLLSAVLSPEAHYLNENSIEPLQRYRGLVKEVEGYQPALRTFWEHWNKLDTDASFAREGVDSSALREAIVGSGAIVRFAGALKDKKSPSFNAELIEFAIDSETRQTIPPSLRALNILRNSLEADGAFDQDQLFSTHDQLMDEARTQRDSRYCAAPAPRSTFEHVTKQIEGIRKLLLTGSMSNVTRAVTELLEFQKDGGAEYLAKTLCNLAGIALKANEPHLAKYLSDRAFELGEEDVVIYTTRAEVFKHLGKFEDASRAYEHTITRFGRYRYAVNGYADVLMDRGMYDQSLDLYDETARLYPDDPVAPNGIATVYFVRGQVDRALSSARKNVRAFGDAVSRVICGNLLRHVGRYSEALQLARESVRVLPDEVLLWIGLVRALALKRDFDKALSEADEILDRFPDSPAPWSIKADILNRCGDTEGSLNVYSTALKSFTSHRPLQVGRASMLILLGRHSEAAEMLDGLELDSESDWRAFHVLVLSKLKAGQTEQAIEDLVWASKHTPWRTLRVMFQSSLGYAYLRHGQQKIAIQLFEGNLLRAAQSTRQGLLLFMGKAFREMGQSDRGNGYLNRAVPTDRSTEILLHSIRETPREMQSARVEAAEFNVLLSAA